MATKHHLDASLALTTLKKEAKVTETELQKAITSDDYLLAGCFDGYNVFLGQLGLTPNEKRDIRAVAREHGSQSAMQTALTLWQKKTPLTATYKALVKIALDLEEGQTAINICKYARKMSEQNVSFERELYSTLADDGQQ